MSIWKGMKQGFKDTWNDIKNPWLWICSLVMNIIAAIISYFTGWEVNDIITTVFGGFISIIVLLTAIVIVKNKIKTGKWFEVD